MSARDLLQIDEGPYAVALHIGSGPDPAAFWEGAAHAVVAVEPDPEAADAARRGLTAFKAPSQVVESVIAGDSGRAPLIRRNLSALTGSREVTGAIEIFPGLREVDRSSVTACSPVELLERTGVRDVQGRKALLVDAPSEALLVLSALKASGDLERFDTVIAVIPSIELHAGGAERMVLEAWATETSMRLVYEQSPEDPDLIYARVESDDDAALAVASARISELEAAYKAAQAESLDQADRGRAAEQSAVQAETRASRAEMALESLKQDLEALRELVQGRDAVIAEQVAHIEALEAGAAEEVEARIEQAEGRATKAEAVAASAARRIRTLEERCAELGLKRDGWRKKVRRAEAKLAEAGGQAEVLRQTQQRLEEQIDELQRNSSALRDKLDAAQTRGDHLQEQAAARENRLLELERELDVAQTRGDHLQEQAAARENRLLELERELEVAQTRGDHLQEQTAARENRLLQLEQELEADRERLREAEGKLEDVAKKHLEALAERDAIEQRTEASVEERRQELRRVQSELAEVRDDLRLALRMQRMAQADLADLQSRYEQLQAENQDAEDLLERVALHLSAEPAASIPGADQIEAPQAQSKVAKPKSKSKSKAKARALKSGEDG